MFLTFVEQKKIVPYSILKEKTTIHTDTHTLFHCKNTLLQVRNNKKTLNYQKKSFYHKD